MRSIGVIELENSMDTGDEGTEGGGLGKFKDKAKTVIPETMIRTTLTRGMSATTAERDHRT
jgi:hypothetical protein